MQKTGLGIYRFRRNPEILNRSALLKGFERPSTLPAMSVLQAGGGLPFRMQMEVFQPGQSTVFLQLQTAGLGGLAAGQLILQPLVDNSSGLPGG